MEESGGNEGLKVGLEEDEVSLLAEEIIHLSVKSTSITPGDKPTLICTIWTKKSYNLDSFRAQMKSIWKTKDYLETILEGQPWMFRKQLVIFDRLVIGVTFGGIVRYKINGEYCRIRVKLDVQKPLRRGHALSNCEEIKPENRDKIRYDSPFSLALKVESSLFGKESLKLNAFSKKKKSQCSYTGILEEIRELGVQREDIRDRRQESDLESVGLGRQLTFQEEGSSAAEEDHERIDEQEGSMKSDRKVSWRRINLVRERGLYNEERIERKRKLIEFEVEDYAEDSLSVDTAKRMKYEFQDLQNREELDLSTEEWGKGDSLKQRLPRGKPTGRNENHLLECPRFGESAGSTKASVLAEAK
ncbi:hypothetical protein EPI10_013820 [Gossypium australe]|uniref:DUF4283 domain-containing protein n=1 Tax=Gossypium australe TaxID=47621 RepID=A0A5B6US91_9ROSI|nr:hypothetical protein EPI10_013820 [Gossypium australe]